MPIEHLPGTDLDYFLISYDALGEERRESSNLLSDQLQDILRREPVTDVFLLSHGWKGDVPAARDQYNRWIGAMLECEADLSRIRAKHPGFRPLIVGFHWPSLPWGDEELSMQSGASSARDAPLVSLYVGRLADTPTAREAITTIVEAARDEINPPRLPEHLREAYQVLDAELELGAEGEGAPPGADREPFDPDLAFEESRDAEGPADYGARSRSGLLWPLRQLSFWNMKRRALRVGENGGARLLTDLQEAATERDSTRFHLMGHSFGCIVSSAAVCGPPGGTARPRPVQSLVLVQGALSLWSYCADIPKAPGRAGYFHRMVADGCVRGPVISTHSEHDEALRTYYPLGAGVARHVSYGPLEWPRYGALGTFGSRGPGAEGEDLAMLPADLPYRFGAGRLYNVNATEYIRHEDGGSDAHNEIDRTEVAHLVWEAAFPSGE